MEHRWSPRVPVSNRVTLFRDKMPVAVCAAKNIGLGGLYVTTGPLVYAKNTTLDVEIRLETKRGPERFRLPACVAFHSQDGVGLMFLESNEEVSESIRRLLRSGEDDQIATQGIDLLPERASR